MNVSKSSLKLSKYIILFSLIVTIVSQFASAESFELYCLGEDEVLDLSSMCNSAMDPLSGPTSICMHLQNNGKICPVQMNYCDNLGLSCPDTGINGKLIISSSMISINNLSPGSFGYTNDITISNNYGSPIILYIGGTDFYDSSSSGARCPQTNQLSLENFAYYAESEGYSTINDPRADEEGYAPIRYGIAFDNPNPFRDSHELIQSLEINSSSFHEYQSNVLDNGESVLIKFRIKTPLPCNGNFDVGKVYIWTKDQEGNVKQYPLSVNINILESYPEVFKCGNVTYLDDATETGRVSEGGEPLIERRTNHGFEDGKEIEWKYLFEGEQMNWKILAMNLRGIENLGIVYVTIEDNAGLKDKMAICNPISSEEINFNSCNLREFENNLTAFNPNIMQYYDCKLTIEPADSMYGRYWTNIEVKDNFDRISNLDKKTFIFANPIISLSVNDNVRFGNILLSKRTYYSNEVSIKNNANEGSGVLLDMFISGSDLSSSVAGSVSTYCSEGQKLKLNSFSYYAELENYSTLNDLEIGRSPGQPERVKDSEGYINIGYGGSFNPSYFYNGLEIIQENKKNEYYLGNQLNQGQEMRLKFKLKVPESCYGYYDIGGIYIWGEAI